MDMVLLAKLGWYSNNCLHIHDMCVNPRIAWEYIRILTNGETAHHKKLVNMAIGLPVCSLVSNSAENIAIFGSHLEQVFSNHQPVDFNNLDLILKNEKLMEIDHPIMFEEVDEAINKHKQGKATGLNGILPEAYEAFGWKMHALIHNRMDSSSTEPETVMDGTRAKVLLFQRREIKPTPIN
jgi:hypothetical protein